MRYRIGFLVNVGAWALMEPNSNDYYGHVRPHNAERSETRDVRREICVPCLDMLLAIVSCKTVAYLDTRLVILGRIIG